jgi:hypothetical protein
MVLKMEVWEKAMQALLDIQNRAASRGVRKQVNKQGLGGSGQNALELMKQMKNNY